jgi:hypothetical protein
MVTARHEAMHRIFQEDPGVFARAFETLGIPFPAPVTASVLSPDATEIRPLERRIDSVIRFETDDGGAYLLAVEAQCRPDPDKPGAWAYYASYLHEKYNKIPVIVLAVCQDEASVRWAEGPFALGFPHWPTVTLRPLVAGPHNVPLITNAVEAERDIPLATLSAITHAWDIDVDLVLKPLATALQSVDEETAQIFAELTELGLGNAPAATKWSKMMAMDTSFFRSRTSNLFRDEGRVDAIAKSILVVLEARGLEVADEVRARVEECTDLDLLREWVKRSVTVERAEQIFDDSAV